MPAIENENNEKNSNSKGTILIALICIGWVIIGAMMLLQNGKLIFGPGGFLP